MLLYEWTQEKHNTAHWATAAHITQDSQPNTLPTELLRTTSHRTASPTHYLLSYWGPHHTGQPAQHTTYWAIEDHITQDSQPNTLPTELLRPTSHRTASPTHYLLSYWGPHHTGQPAQHTTHWAIEDHITQDSQPNTLPTELLRTTSHRTASPTHYPLSYWGPHHTGQPAQHTTYWAIEDHITQDSQPNTLPTELLRTTSLRTASPTHYPLSYWGPHHTGQPAQHTTHWAIEAHITQDSQPNTLPTELLRPTSHRTASPTHYPLSYWGPHHTGQPAQHTAHWAIEAHITQDSQPNTLPTELLRPTSHRTANPTHYPLSYWGPHHTGQPAQHTTHWAIEAHITQDSQPNTLPTELLRPTSHRTASPTHYLLSYWGPHHTGQPAQHTTHWAIEAHITQDSQPNTLPTELLRPTSHRTASPTHCPLSYWGPHHTGQPAQHTTHWAIEAHITQDSQPNTLPTELLRTTSHRTASPTHYPLSYWGPHHTGQPAQHTTHWAIEDHITQDSQPNTLPTELLRTTSHRTASPTHYLLSYWGPHHSGQPAQHTTHWAIEAHITQDSQPNTLPTELLRPTSHRTASPTHYPLSYWGPHHTGQPAQHTTHWAIEAHITQDSQPNTLPTELLRPTSHRTASPTHYLLSYWGPHHTGQPAQHTTHWAIEAHITQDSQPNTLPTELWAIEDHCITQDSQPNTLPTKLLRTTSHRTASPTHYPLSYWGPHHTGQPAQHTTHWAIEDHITQDSQPNTLPTELLRTTSHRTASPTHYLLSYWGPHHTGQPAQHTTYWAIEAHITQDSQPNTLPTELLRPTSHRTASPTHYPLSYWGPHHTGQPAQHTTYWAVAAHNTLFYLAVICCSW